MLHNEQTGHRSVFNHSLLLTDFILKGSILFHSVLSFFRLQIKRAFYFIQSHIFADFKLKASFLFLQSHLSAAFNWFKLKASIPSQSVVFRCLHSGQAWKSCDHCCIQNGSASWFKQSVQQSCIIVNCCI